MSELGIAIIGTGTVAERHAEAIRALHGASLTAVYDTDPDRCRNFAGDRGVTAAPTLEKLLTRQDVDIVTIATPSGVHADVAVPAAGAGKHIICEKPLEITLERTDLIIKACDDAGVRLAAIFQARFGSNVRLIRNALDEGRFGRMILASAQVRWYRSPEYYAGAGWRGTWALDGGGALMNQSIHIIDLLLFLAGDVEEVTAYTGTLTHPGLEVEDTAVAVLKFVSGGFGVIEASTSCAPGFPRKLELSGQNGSVILEDDRIVRWQFADERRSDAGIREKGSKSEGLAGGAGDPRAAGFEGHRRQFQDMVDAINQGRPPVLQGREGRKAIQLITCIYESARNGRPCRL